MQSKMKNRTSCRAFFISRIPCKRTCGTREMKKAPSGSFIFDCGERGIRTPGGVTLNGFQDRRIRPLCHLSGANIRSQSLYSEQFLKNLWIRALCRHTPVKRIRQDFFLLKKSNLAQGKRRNLPCFRGYGRRQVKRLLVQE